MRLSRLVAPLLLLPLTVAAQSAPTSSLRQQMTPNDFRAAGLDKLSPQELSHLDAWLAGHARPATRMVTRSGAPAFYSDKQKRRAIDAHLVGHFSGWNGRNLMTLDNGQQWKQVGSDTVTCSASDNAEVRVKPSLFGNWLMFVDGCNGNVHVKRVR